MRVTVRFHEDCKADLRDWLKRQPGSAEDRRLLMSVAIEALKVELAKTMGHPHEAAFESEPSPPSYWWKLNADCWVRYRITDTRSMLGRRSRTIEILSLSPTGPS